MYVQQFFIDGLGCASYLVGCEEHKVGAVIDPDRDVSLYLEAAQAQGLQITHIIETHLHADHVSGNTELAARTGAEIYIHEAAGAEFPHQTLKEGDLLSLGNVRIQVKHTPGHTPESVSLLIQDTRQPEEPQVALTGDTLFVGDVGRPDLVGAEAARGLAADLYDSLFGKLLRQEDSLVVYPGHGAGSLCGRAIGTQRSTTLGQERAENPALKVQEKEAFITYMTENLPEQPGNHHRIKAMNRQGPKVLGEIEPRALTIQAAIPYFQRGAGLLDTRSKEAFVEKHVPGSVHLPADEQLSNRAGFILPPEAPLVLLVEDEAAYRQAVMGLRRVGFEQVAGYLEGGLTRWEAAGLPVTSGDIEDITTEDLDRMLAEGEDLVIIDVREPWEFAMGHIPGAELIPLGQLAHRLEGLDREKPVAAICATGSRSQSAAALLGQKGFKKVYNVSGGMETWMYRGLETAR